MVQQAEQTNRSAGGILRYWRESRRLSQLELSTRAGISTRHLSFVETGRSRPSRDMVLHLAEQLDIPLRARNQLLLAAGYAPQFPETPPDSPALAAVRTTVRQVLVAQEPFPAFAVDGAWNMLDSNDSVRIFTEGIDKDLLRPPVNVLRASLHPRGLAPRIINLPQWRWHVLTRLYRQAAMQGDPMLAALHEELRSYPGSEQMPDASSEEQSTGIAVRLRLRHHDRQLCFLSTATVFGTPLDVTVAELTVETFLPADPYTSEVLRPWRPVAQH
ncbi:Helix-turn-helix [Micromonospora matsumotoense]|uniref:Helix-turn-helix n=1 Tax=Micromonospora matsumotoense TaxID=121616 RepID=A0A1C5AX14_9ACTN|nr:helix-turn-helix transcriptional regulator [Micromonospora matsumotoense]SCF49686.1 Helix-turn-helix [Micromonospora matsumotoense]